MPAYFLDSSALVKRFARETGTAWILKLFKPSAHHMIYIARVTPVETAAGLARQHRTGALSQQELEKAIARLGRGMERRFGFVEIGGDLIDSSISLVRRYALRGYDAVQLAAALELSIERRKLSLAGLTFVSADQKLNAAAELEGLIVEDPTLNS